jgi:uroporphyrinogen-III synthase
MGHYNDLNNARPKGAKPPLLFLVGEQHRDAIPRTLMSADLPQEQRIPVDELIVYETGVMKLFELAFPDALKEVCHDGGEGLEGDEAKEGTRQPVIWIVVFSPTGCDVMLRTLGLIRGDTSPVPFAGRKRCYIATIGPTTRDHLRANFGIEPDVCAERPSPEGLGASIEQFIARGRKL